ncbi:MAG: adenylate/guanylate cyclase domain-containing protein [Leptospiraceae bacterium]|nr:adenylate/guanylate cyclase domain-containing protein [Leptospiraceae bacterium]
MNEEIFPTFALNLILFGSLFILGLYFFILYFYQKTEKQSFYFSLFSFVIALRLLNVSLPILPFKIDLLRLNYLNALDILLSIFSIYILLRLIHSLYQNLISKKLIQSLNYLFMIFVCFHLFFFYYLPSFNSYINLGITIIFSSYFVFLGFQVYFKKLEDYKLFTFGLLILLISALKNSFEWKILGYETFLIQFSIFLFFGIQSYILARRMNQSFIRTEILSDEIKNSNNLAELFNRTYEKFVPKKFLNILNSNFHEELHLGENTEKELTIQFTQIQDFWKIVRGIPSENIYKFINSYISRVSPSIQNNNGIIDKFIDNTILSLFPESPDDAVKAAIQLQWEIEIYNIHRKKTGYLPIECGCGMHYGSTRIGIIGDESRQELTVISDTVNLASRIQGLTEKYGARILISLPSLYKCNSIHEINYRMLDMVRVKGKTIHISIGEILIPRIDLLTDLKIETKFDFEEGILSYIKADFALAMEHFKKVLKINSGDKAAQMYFERAKYFLETGSGDDFKGIHQWESK